MSAIMGGPIANSLGAGVANRDFFSHGAVTFARGLLVIVRQQICLNGQIQTTKVITGRINAIEAMNAGFIDRIPLVGETITINSINGEIRTAIQMTGIVEECN